MQPGVLLAHVVDIVGGHQRRLCVVSHADDGFVHPALFGDAVVLQFQIDVVVTVNLLQLPQVLPC